MKFNNERGQFALEAVLLMTIMLAASLAGIKVLKENDVLSQLVETPWQRTAGMIETGVWGPAAKNKKNIPYNFSRFYTPKNQ